MTTKELAVAVANEKGSPIAAAREDVNMVIDCIARAIAKGEDVKISGLGTFKVKTSAARKARNPKTGEEIQIPAKKVAKFIPAKELKTKLQG